MNAADICSICAWRGDCKKKFSISGRDVRCPDFSKDLALEKEKDLDKDKAGEKPDKPKA